MERKDYKCPECGAMMEYHQHYSVKCTHCLLSVDISVIEVIERLKQQIYGMRNCENCGNYKKGKGIFAPVYCQLDTEDECIENDRKHWKFGKE